MKLANAVCSKRITLFFVQQNILPTVIKRCNKFDKRSAYQPQEEIARR